MRAARVDSNQGEIVKALRARGCFVQSLATVGRGCPDLMVCTPDGCTHLLEVKGKAGKLTPDQEQWHTTYPGPVHVVRSIADALEAVGL